MNEANKTWLYILNVEKNMKNQKRFSIRRNDGLNKIKFPLTLYDISSRKKIQKKMNVNYENSAKSK